MSREHDANLVGRCAAGSAEALQELYDRHSRGLLRFLERMLGDPGLAEDVCQEAFLRLWRKANMFDPRRGTFSAWLYRAASNLAFNRLALRSSTETTLEGGGELTGPGSDQPVASAHQGERGELLHRALARLSPGDRAILTLRHLEERPVAEVASILEILEGTVKSRVHYALHRLRSFLEPTLGAPEETPE